MLTHCSIRARATFPARHCGAPNAVADCPEQPRIGAPALHLLHQQGWLWGQFLCQPLRRPGGTAMAGRTDQFVMTRSALNHGRIVKRRHCEIEAAQGNRLAGSQAKIEVGEVGLRRVGGETEQARNRQDGEAQHASHRTDDKGAQLGQGVTSRRRARATSVNPPAR